jgi:AcrR family transcriptional regulator
VYRHFPDRSALVEALAARLEALTGPEPVVPRHLEDLKPIAVKLMRDLEAHHVEARAEALFNADPRRYTEGTNTHGRLLGALVVAALPELNDEQQRAVAAVLRTLVNAPPVMAELATSLITDGVAGRIVEWKRKEVAARQEIAARVLRGMDVQTHSQSPHAWVKLPEPWLSEAFVSRARHRGILVTGAESFAAGHETNVQAIRLALGAPSTRAALEEGLGELVRMVNRVPEAYELVV